MNIVIKRGLLILSVTSAIAATHRVYLQNLQENNNITAKETTVIKMIKEYGIDFHCL